MTGAFLLKSKHEYLLILWSEGRREGRKEYHSNNNNSNNNNNDKDTVYIELENSAAMRKRALLSAREMPLFTAMMRPRP